MSIKTIENYLDNFEDEHKKEFPQKLVDFRKKNIEE